MRPWIWMVLAACGSTTNGPTVTNTVADTRPADVHRWREAMIDATVTALAAGDTEALVALSDPASAFAAPSECEHHRREELGAAAGKAKGLKLEVTSLTLERPDDMPRRYAEHAHVASGDKLAGCVAKTALVVHEIPVKLRIERDGKKHHQNARIQLVETGGRFYLTHVPEDIGDADFGSKALAIMRKFSDRMCQCTDKACADQVQEDMTKWGTEAARNSTSDDRPDPEMIKESGEIMTRYVECMTKLMTQSMQSGGSATP